MTRVLIVDDDNNLRRVLRMELGEAGFSVNDVESGQKAMEILSKEDFDILLLDLNMPGIQGLEVLQWIRQEEVGVEVVILTANATIQTAVEAMRMGAYDYLTKPFKFDELGLVIQKAAEKNGLVRENRRLRSRLARQESFPEIVTAAPAMRELLETVRRIAPSTVPVHIFGESGVGKELVARGIHSASDRAGQAFVALNCAAITESMFESELFGHEKGAFTGAQLQKPGLLEIASGGTLFIDEVGEMPLPVQVKLLRVLETGVFYRVGGVREIKVDFRLVSASNKDLVKESDKGTFRKDLYWRIGGVTLQVPPLREHPEDIPLLVQHFLDMHPQFKHKHLAADSLALLVRYAWPGNVRELFHLLHRACLLSRDDRLAPGEFPGLTPETALPASGSLKLEDVERAHILRVLKESKGHRSRAAELLGIDPKTLYRKLQHYDIQE
jgi:DNA-binding NtrC family response regulator